MKNEFRDLGLSQSFTLKNGSLIEFSEAEPASMAHAAVPKVSRGAKISPGTVLDSKYRLLSILGEGGMGTVYRAHHLLLKKDVALKTIHSNQLSQEALVRFEREVKSVAALQNTHVVQVFDFGIAESNQPYYTMELLTGQSLADRLEKSGPITVDETLTIFSQVALALISAHNKGIIHRDLKPANIFLHEQNGKVTVKLVDFGIAKLLGSSNLDGQKLTATGTIFGSPLYMSPEQSLGQIVDARSDIYSLGCALVESLTGKPPFIGPNAFATFYMHQHDNIPRLSDLAPNLSFPAGLETLVERMLTKDPEERIQSCEEVLDVLQFQITNKGRDQRHKSEKSEKSTGTKAVILSSVFLVTAVSAAILVLAQFSQTKPQSSPQAKQQTEPQTEPLLQPSTNAPAQDLNARSEAESSPADLYKDFNRNASAKDNLNQPRAGLPSKLFTRENQTLSRSQIKEIVSTKAEVAELSGDTLNNNDLDLLQKSALRKLNAPYSNLDDTGAEAISQCRTLSFLRISHTKVSENGLLSLAKLNGLTKLYIDGLPVSSTVLTAWSKNPALNLLSLNNCPALDYKTLAPLQKSRISELTLKKTDLNDSALLAIKNLSDLKLISVGFTNVTADGIERLCQRQPKLIDVKIMGCPNISTVQVAKLRNQFRQITFDTEELAEFDKLWEKPRR